MTKYLHILFTSILLLFLNTGYNQAGIYAESEMEYQSLFFDAELAKQKGKTTEQIKILKEILRRNPEEGAVYYELSKAFFTEDNSEMAIKNAEKANKFYPANEWYLLNHAEICEHYAQHAKAIKTYEQLTLIVPENEVVFHRLAFNYLSLNDKENAIRVLTTLQEKEGITEETSRRLFDIYNKSGDKTKALTILQSLSDKYPNNTRFLNNLAGFMLELGQINEAKNVYAKVLQLDPNNVQASMAMVKEKTTRSEAGDYLTSLIPVMQNINIPLDNKIMELMPFISTMDKEDVSTQSLLRISDLLVELYPDDAKVYAIKGDVNFYAGNFSESEAAYTKSISFDDRKFTLWDQWMLNLWELESYAKLKKISYEAIDLFPNQVDAYILHALALSQLDDSENAVEYIEEAQLIGGRHKRYASLIGLANLWVQNKNTSQDLTKATIEKLKYNEHTNHIYFELLGDLYQRLGDTLNSKKYWEEAIVRGASKERIYRKIKA